MYSYSGRKYSGLILVVLVVERDFEHHPYGNVLSALIGFRNIN